MIAAVRQAEPDLAVDVLEDTLAAAAPTWRLLAGLDTAIRRHPDLLVSGIACGPRASRTLIALLRQGGAEHVVVPGCGQCRRTVRLSETHEGLAICSSCARRLRRPMATCGVCRRHARVAARDETGRPMCTRCCPEPAAEHVSVHAADQVAGQDRGDLAAIITHLNGLGTGLDPARLQAICRTVAATPALQRTVRHALEADPGLLSIHPARGPHRGVLLAEALLGAGARNVAVPACGFCGRAVLLRDGRDGLRCCNTCYRTGHAQPCSRCGRAKPVTVRASTGQSLCAQCAWSARPQTVCSFCGTVQPCRADATTGLPRCRACYHRQRPQEQCVRCARPRPVGTRTSAGEPLCAVCARSPEQCHRCGRTERLAARPPEGPLCSRCWRKDPASAHPCDRCGAVYPQRFAGLCPGCAAHDRLTLLLTHPDGTLHPAAGGVLRVLLALKPWTAVGWSCKSTTRPLLRQIAQLTEPLSHELLDSLPPSGTVAALRERLLAAAALPVRDEHLARLEHRAEAQVATIASPTERRLVQQFFTWHDLARLRRHARRASLTNAQVSTTLVRLRTVIGLLAWTADHDLSLATLTQDHLDDWLATGPSSTTTARPFLRWAVRHGHATRLEIPAANWQSPRPVLPHQDQRWTLIQRLLTDAQITLTDRAAGLLVLLYGQNPHRITRLTLRHVRVDHHGTHLQLGTTAVQLPAPVADLLHHLPQQPRGSSNTDPHTASPWLFPGRTPGRHRATAAMAVRLRTLGIPVRASRNTAMTDLATQLPAPVLTRLLGLSPTAAARWTTETGNTRPAYAAVLSATTRQHRPPKHPPGDLTPHPDEPRDGHRR